MTSNRREDRERTLSLLYEAEIRGLARPDQVIENLPLPPEPYVVELLVGIGDHQGQIDELISRFAKDWTLERMAAIDRAILRLGTFELLAMPDIPTGVAISEAVALATIYSTEESSRFVNGMISSISSVLRTDAGGNVKP